MGVAQQVQGWSFQPWKGNIALAEKRHPFDIDFDTLLADIINKHIFCVHGALWQHLRGVHQRSGKMGVGDVS